MVAVDNWVTYNIYGRRQPMGTTSTPSSMNKE